MPQNRRDTKHTPRELEAATAHLIGMLETSTGSKSQRWGRERDLIPERLLLSEITFLTERCREMSKKEHLAFLYFLRSACDSMRFRRKDSQLPHALYIGSIFTQLLLSMDSDTDIGRDTIHYPVVNALKGLKFCRQQGQIEDFEARDLPLIRGELIYDLLAAAVPSHKHQYGHSQFYRWLSEHEKEVFAVLPVIIERNVVNRRLIRQLVDNASKPLTEGVL